MAKQEESETGFAGWQYLPTDIDVTPEEWLKNPYPRYERKRESNGGIHYDDDQDVWLIFRFDDVKDLANRTDGKDFTAAETPAPEDSELAPLNHIFDFEDPGDGHTVKKEVLMEFFSSAYVDEHYRGPTEEIIADQLDAAIAKGDSFDYVEDFASPIPAKVISDVIGFRKDRYTELVRVTKVFSLPSDDEIEGGLSDEERQKRLVNMMNYLDSLLQERKENPKDDLMSELVGKEKANGEEFTRKEILGTCVILFAAGGATTVNLLTLGIWTFQEESIYEEMRNGGTRCRR